MCGGLMTYLLTMENIITERLELLRREMRAESIDAIIILSTDPHGSEYVAEHWHCRQWISGFTGSNGTAVITQNAAALWTDSRYFLQAEEQLKGTEYQLMREGLSDTPSIVAWIKQKLSVYGGDTVAVDGMLMSYAEVCKIQNELRGIGGITLRTNYDPMKILWKERPAIPANEIRVHPIKYAGVSVEEKLDRVRMTLKGTQAEALLLTNLMEIAWLTNLRGGDVKYTPVFMAFMYVTLDDAFLYVGKDTLTEEARQQMEKAGIGVREYSAFPDDMRKRRERLVCSENTCYTLYNIVKEYVVSVSDSYVSVGQMKSVKNEAEIKGFKEAMLQDGVAMVRFLKWLVPAVESGGQTEISISEKLRDLRLEGSLCRDLSFATIAGYAEHGAIVHYQANEESNCVLNAKGLLLVDSGGQYAGGTTDITRTIALGPITHEMRKAYTLVLKANIALATLRFPEGTTGTQIDAVARQILWREGLNYLHGTGHGVGACLSVHEGPHAIRMNWMPEPLKVGMTITDEPGVYLAGRFGIRIENTMLVVEAEETEFGKFLRLDPLTLCPIDTTPIIVEMLTDEERKWFDAYHKRVSEALMPLLSDEKEKEWLRKVTQPLV